MANNLTFDLHLQSSSLSQGDFRYLIWSHTWIFVAFELGEELGLSICFALIDLKLVFVGRDIFNDCLIGRLSRQLVSQDESVRPFITIDIQIWIIKTVLYIKFRATLNLSTY